MALLNTECFKKNTGATEKDTKSFVKNKYLNSHSRNTKDFNQQAQHQLDFMLHPRYTS